MRPLLLLFLLACKVTPPQLSDEPVTPPECTTLATDACESATHCAVVQGVPVGNPASEELCRDPARAPDALGCQDITHVCPPAEVTVQDPADGEAYVVATGCIPDGFGVINQAVPVCRSCSDTPPDQCAETEGCQLVAGRPILDDPAGPQCLPADSMAVGLACIEQTGCGDAISWGSEGPDTLIHQFPDTCLPPGWIEASPVDDCACSDFDADRCPTECAVVFGRPLHDNTCIDFGVTMQAVACGEQGDCGDAESYAADPANGDYWWFPTTCTPQGWGTVPAGSYPACE